jgi:hypothetical protein
MHAIHTSGSQERREGFSTFTFIQIKTDITSSFFVSVLTYISIFFDDREYSLLHTFRPLVWFGFALFSPFFIVHWTLENVFPRIRLYISFARKSKEVIRSKESIDIPLQTQFKPQWEGYHIPKTKLMKVLNIEHVLLNVVEYMHHGDVVNLSLACRAVREAVYPAGDLEFRRPKLEKACESAVFFEMYLHSHCYAIHPIR